MKRLQYEAEREYRLRQYEAQAKYTTIQGPFGIGSTGPGGYGSGAGGNVNIAYNKVVNNMDLGAEESVSKKKVVVKDLDVFDAARVIGKVLKTNITPFLWGPPGIGKSSLVKEIAEENKWELIDLRLSLLNPVDLRGLPMLDKNKQLATWLPPSFLPKEDEKKQGILFLDEINLAPLSVQAAAYQLILDKRVGSYRFPKNWRIVAAGNRETDRANVYRLSAPLANRFVHFNITTNFKNWKVWAKDNGIRPEIIDYLITQPSLLMQMPKEQEKAFPTPRSWHFTSDLLEAFDYDPDKPVDDSLNQLIIGTIGEGVGKEFIEYLGNYSLQGLSRMVEKFKKTGEYTMPKEHSLRYSFITAIAQAYFSDEITPQVYHDFVKTLSNEEQNALTIFEEQEGARVRQRKGVKTIKPDMNKPMTVLLSPIYPTDDHEIKVLDPTFLKGNKAILFDNKGNIEEITFKKRTNSSIVEIERGRGNTSAKNWDKGTYIQSV